MADVDKAKIEQAVRLILEGVGDDPDREGVRDTPRRVDATGNVAFYLLTSTREADTYPIGGHYRAEIAPDGSVVATRRYMNTCFDLPTALQKSPDGGPGHAGVSYLFGDAPSEIHVLASFQFEDGFMVIAQSSRKLWLVRDGQITLVKADFNPAE